MKNFRMRVPVMSMVAGCLCACLTACTAVPEMVRQSNGATLAMQTAPEREIGFRTYTFNFLGQYRITHDYFSGKNISGCYPMRKDSDTNAGDMFESDKPGWIGQLYQKGWWGGRNEWYEKSLQDYVEGFPVEKKIGNKIINTRSFHELCGGRFNGFSYTVSIRKKTIQSIEKSIEISNAFKSIYLDETSAGPFEVQRGDNCWIVYKVNNPALYLADEYEEWFLNIGKTDYYYRLTFGYKSAEAKADTVSYRHARANFGHILDSFKIEKLPS